MEFKKVHSGSLIPAGDGKLDWLQALRGAAALMVVFFHMVPHWEVSLPLKRLTGAMHFGFAGVDVFFVLSGFVVYWSAKKSTSLAWIADFIRRRALRIYLGYWPVLLVTAVGSALFFQKASPPMNKLLGSIFLLYPSLFDNWLPTAWSLTYELYFYSWIACIVLLPLRYRLPAMAGTLCLLVLWNALWLILWPQDIWAGVQPLRFLLTGYGVEFLLGGMVAEVYKRFENEWPRPAVMLPLSLSVAFVGFSVGTTSHYFDKVEIMRVGSFGVFALGVFFATLTLQNYQFKAPKWLVLVGDASFSLYLLHPFILDVAGSLRFRFFNETAVGAFIFLMLLPFMISGISIAWFKLVEYPLMRMVSPRNSGAGLTAAKA